MIVTLIDTEAGLVTPTAMASSGRKRMRECEERRLKLIRPQLMWFGCKHYSPGHKIRVVMLFCVGVIRIRL